MEEQTLEGGGGVEKQVGGGDGDPQQSPMVPTRKGKSCKGCLYYSSLLKANAHNPFCIGISRTLQQVPGYIVGESEIEATKEGRSLTDFKYACVGYSVFMNNKDNPSDKQENGAELPFCAGIEMVPFIPILDLTNQLTRSRRNSSAGLKGTPDWWLLVWRETSTEWATISKKTSMT